MPWSTVRCGFSISASPCELAEITGFTASGVKACRGVGGLRGAGVGELGLEEHGDSDSSFSGTTRVDPFSMVKPSAGLPFCRCHDIVGRCSSSPGMRESFKRSPEGGEGFFGGVLLPVKALRASATV